MRIALLGCGTVGGGVARIVDERVPELEVARILTLPGELDDPRVVNDIADIADDPTIEAVVEAMGGLEPARSFIMRCLEAGKSVVTANKAVVAAYLPEFCAKAEEKGAGFFIEATSGGGIPWIASIEKVRRIDEVESIAGILNGTSNYIIDRMAKEGAEFDDVLADAQRLGYAEACPSADIDGYDVKNKCIISSTVAFGSLCRSDIPVFGIRNLTKADMEVFAGLGYHVRLMARACQKDGAYAAAVEPVLLSAASVDGNVPDNFNIATLVGTTVGPLKFYGQGAGSLPTGNAIVQDLIDCAGGARPVYATEETLAWDPSLLRSDYIFRTDAPIEGAEAVASGYALVRGITAVEANALAAQLATADPATFMAAVVGRV